MLSFHIRGKFVCIKKEVIVPLFMLIFTISYYWQAHTLSSKSLAFPRVFLIILFISSLYSIIKSVTIVTPDVEEAEKAPLFTKKVLLYFTLLTAFILLLPYVGVYIAIPAFLIITMFSLNVRSIKTLILVPVGVTAAIHLLFVVLLSTRLPAGPF